MEKAYRVNIDFESQVNQQTIKCLKPAWQREWEYLFWWLEPDEHLLVGSQSTYQKEDIEYLKEMTGRNLFFTQKNSDWINWWGDPLQKNIIQKTDLPLLRQRVYDDYSSKVAAPDAFPCVIKINGHFGGKGVYFLDTERAYSKLKNQLGDKQLIVEPFRQITLDFSYYVFKNKIVYYRSDVDAKGKYRGSLFSKNLNWLPQEGFVKSQTQKLVSELKVDNFGVDCYFYRAQGSEVLEPLCEVNNRRTIASCVYEIYQKYYSEYAFAKNLLIPMKHVKNLKNFNDKRVIRLSPKNGQYFYHVLILENNENDLLNLTNEFQEFLNRS